LAVPGTGTATLAPASIPDAQCRQTPSCFIHKADPRKTFDVSPQEREAFWKKLYAKPGFGIWIGNLCDILRDEKANAVISEFIAKKIRQRVNDPKVAEQLIPKDHGFGTRRVPLESGYFEAYNRDNVHLVDIVNDEPIRSITGAFDQIDFRGPNAVPLKDVWAQGQPRTYLGMLADGFPNMLIVLGPHAA
jgi:hypothetical protein